LDRDLPGVPSLPGWFRDHGYYTLARGKIFDSTIDSPDSWTEPLWSPEGEWTSAIEPDERGEHIQRAYLDNPEGVLGPAFERLDVEDSDYPDGQIADKTVEDLRRMSGRDEPFFLAVGFRKPHLPFNAPAKYWDLYDPADLRLPSTYYGAAVGTPPYIVHTSFELRNNYSGIPSEGLLEESQALNLIHAYRAAVSYADALVGKVLGALEDNGLADNTIVMLIGDHGWNLGEQTMWTKMNLFDIALHTPMIIRDPSRASGRAAAITDFLDIFPTLVELAGLPAVDELDGVSLVPVLEDPSRTVKTASFSRWFDGESVRTERYRYTEWRSEEGEITDRMLFDLSLDPNETRSVAEEGAYADVVRELSALITADESFVEWSPIVRRNVANRSR
jgi:arylsulfatase A-like enzyme